MEGHFETYPEKEYHEDLSKETEELIELRALCKEQQDTENIDFNKNDKDK